MARRRRRFSEHWLNDPRLPDDADAVGRIYGLRPGVKMPRKRPHRTTVLAECFLPPGPQKAARRLRVLTDRGGKTFWFTASYGFDKPDTPFSQPAADGRYYLTRADEASTSSKKIGQGWVDAVRACSMKRR